MGLKTIVREELKKQGKTWNQKAPQAAPNKKEAARLAARQRGYASIMATFKGHPGAHTLPGSYRK